LRNLRPSHQAVKPADLLTSISKTRLEHSTYLKMAGQAG
jgi:hypothetical protein